MKKTLWGDEVLKPGRQFSLLYSDEREYQSTILELLQLTLEKNWKVLYLYQFHQKESIIHYGDSKNLMVEPGEDFFPRKDLSPQKAIQRLTYTCNKILQKAQHPLCLMIEMDYRKAGEGDLLELESLINQQLTHEQIVPVSIYQVKTLPITFLSRLVLFHSHLIFHNTICKNHNPVKHDILQIDPFKTILYQLLETFKRLQSMEEGLQRSRDLCLTLFEEFPNPLFLADAQGDFIDFNHGWLHFTGNSLQEEKGEGWLKGLKDGDQESFRQKFQENLNQRTSFEAEFYLRHHSGIFKYILCSAKPIWNLAGDFSGFFFSCYDISTIREKEEEKIMELEKELLVLKEISEKGNTSITAASLGLTSIKDGLPEVFERLKVDYQRLMEGTIEERIFGKKNHQEEEKRAFINKLGFLQASPRDLIEIHSSVLEYICAKVTEEKALVFVDEGRILVLEIMGYLASFYRKHCSGLEQ